MYTQEIMCDILLLEIISSWLLIAPLNFSFWGGCLKKGGINYSRQQHRVCLPNWFDSAESYAAKERTS